MDKRPITVLVLKGDSGNWYWKIKGRNGRILAHSESYSSRAKAIKTAKIIEQTKFIVEVE